MDTLVEEVRVWNTPIVGAFLLWKFTEGYISNHPSGDAPIGMLHFIALPILLNRTLNSAISNRRDDLQSFIRSFEDAKTSDLLLSIHDKVAEKKMYTLQSIDIGVSNGLLYWDYDTGKIYSKSVKNIRGNRLRSSLEKEGNKAQILGRWFAKHDLNVIIDYLKITL